MDERRRAEFEMWTTLAMLLGILGVALYILLYGG